MATTPGRRPANDSNGQAAAVRFMYQTKGSHVVRHDVVWDGQWTFAGPGVSAGGTLPAIRSTADLDYLVIEVRAVPTG